MDYSALFRRAAEIVWARKFLIVLGMLAALSSGGGSSTAAANFNNGDGRPLDVAGFEFIMPDLGDIGVALPIVALIAALILVIAIAFFVVGTVARGGLIAGVDALDRGKASSFGLAWSAAWEKVWTLTGIGLLPAVPAFFGVLFGLGGAAASSGLIYTGEIGSALGIGAAGFFGLVTAMLLIIAFFLGLLQVFANRAAVLEDAGVLDAYGRGFTVLSQNLGSALGIFVIQIGISLVLGALLLVPGIILALCFLFWPLFLIFQGFMSAFFSAVWTRAWGQWTDTLPAKNVPALGD